MLRTRLSSSAGQVAAEYMGGLLLVAVVIGALLGAQVHTKIAVEVERAICKITGSAQCGEPGVPQAEDSGDEPGEPDREVHDAECDNDLPGDCCATRATTPPAATPRPTRSTTTSARSSTTTPTPSAATPTTTPAAT